MTEAWLVKIERAFGGDNAFYDLRGVSGTRHAVVAVGWALLATYVTTVKIDGERVAEYTDKRYVQPPEALARLGYEVHGLVDFAAVQAPVPSPGQEPDPEPSDG